MMTVNAETVFQTMLDTAADAFKDGWDAVKVYAPAEFKKMSVQLAEIAENVALYMADKSKGYSKATGKILFNMQKTACESVLVAVTQLTLLSVQKALSAIFKVLRDTFTGVFAGIL